MMRPSGNAGEGPVPGLPGPGGPLGVWTGLPALDGLATPPGTGCAPWTAWRRRPVPAARPVAADRHPGAAPRRGLQAAPPRHRPGRPDHRGPLADHQLGWVFMSVTA